MCICIFKGVYINKWNKWKNSQKLIFYFVYYVYHYLLCQYIDKIFRMLLLQLVYLLTNCLLSFISSIFCNVSTVLIFIKYGIDINIGDLLTYNATSNAVITASAVGPFGALIYFAINYIATKYNIEFANDLEKFFLKHLIFTFAGGFSSYLTDNLLPINNDKMNINDILDYNNKRDRASTVSMLLSALIGIIFSLISSTIIKCLEKKHGDPGVNYNIFNSDQNLDLQVPNLLSVITDVGLPPEYTVVPPPEYTVVPPPEYTVVPPPANSNVPPPANSNVHIQLTSNTNV